MAPIVCHTLTTSSGASGNISNASDYAITATGSITLDSTGTVRLGAVLITGDGDFHIGSAVGATTLTNCTVEMRGTGNFDIDKAGLTFVSVKFNASGKVIQSTGDAAYTTGRLYITAGTTTKFNAQGITVTTYVAGDIDGNPVRKTILRSTANGVYWPFVNPTSMTVLYADIQDSQATNSIITVGCKNSGHLVNWVFNLTAVSRSIGTKTVYTTGTVAVDSTGYVITLTGGSWDTNWGIGDSLRIYTGASFNADFSDDFETFLECFVDTWVTPTQLTLQLPMNTLVSTSGLTYAIQRAYDTPAAWFAGSPTNPISDNIVWKGQAYNDTVFTTGFIGTASGFDTTMCDATRYHHLTVPTSQRHAGVYGAGVRAEMRTSSTTFLSINGCPYFLLEFWSVKNNAADTVFATNYAGASTDYLRVRNCIAYGSYSNVNQEAIRIKGADSYAQNNIVYGNYTVGVHVLNSANAYNNTVYSAGSIMTTGIYVETSNSTGENNLAMNASGVCFADAGAASDYNMSRDATAVGVHSLKNRSVTSPQQFVSITPGSENLHLYQTSEALSAGANLGSTNNVNIDIDGTDRLSL